VLAFTILLQRIQFTSRLQFVCPYFFLKYLFQTVIRFSGFPSKLSSEESTENTIVARAQSLLAKSFACASPLTSWGAVSEYSTVLLSSIPFYTVFSQVG